VAGKKGMHDRILSPQSAEHIRSKIKTTQLINLLTEVSLTGQFQGKNVDLSRLRAAEILLRKALPDLSATEMSGSVTTYQDTLRRVAETMGWATAAAQVASEPVDNPVDNDDGAAHTVDSASDATSDGS
jgi:hypothetical protein